MFKTLTHKKYSNKIEMFKDICWIINLHISHTQNSHILRSWHYKKIKILLEILNSINRTSETTKKKFNSSSDYADIFIFISYTHYYSLKTLKTIFMNWLCIRKNWIDVHPFSLSCLYSFSSNFITWRKKNLMGTFFTSPNSFDIFTIKKRIFF